MHNCDWILVEEESEKIEVGNPKNEQGWKWCLIDITMAHTHTHGVDGLWCWLWYVFCSQLVMSGTLLAAYFSSITQIRLDYIANEHYYLHWIANADMMSIVIMLSRTPLIQCCFLFVALLVHYIYRHTLPHTHTPEYTLQSACIMLHWLQLG